MSDSGTETTADWLERFHAGDGAVMEACYLEHYSTVQRAISGLVSGVDLENQIHELFFRLLKDEKMRRSFTGGAIAAWLTTTARNQAIDFLRRKKREVLVEPDGVARIAGDLAAAGGQDEEARRMLETLRARVPEKWLAVFDARFIENLTQRQAASKLRISRTTLAYREARILSSLRKFIEQSGMEE